LNGYVKFETPDGDVLAINADSVSFVRATEELIKLAPFSL